MNPLKLPAKRGVRAVALDLLDETTRAADKLVASRDRDALHDFRVALRRLRSWLRAFKHELRGTVRRKDRRTLRDIAAATNLGRDTDVQLQWLSRAARRLCPQGKHAAHWLTRYLTARQRQAGDPLDAALIDSFHRIRDRLADRLERDMRPAVDQRRKRTLARAMADQLVAHCDALDQALRRVKTTADERPAHKARIGAKRLRYLLEPAAEEARRGATLLARLKRLQDELGALHDAHVMAHQLHAALEAAATAEVDELSARVLGGVAAIETTPSVGDGTREPLGFPPIGAAPRAGVLNVAQRLELETRASFDRVKDQWGARDFARLSRELATFGDQLDKAPARKHLRPAARRSRPRARR